MFEPIVKVVIKQIDVFGETPTTAILINNHGILKNTDLTKIWE